MIVFEFGDAVSVLLIDRGIRIVSPMAVVVGLQTTRKLEMELCGKINDLAMMFQADGLQRLFSIPSRELPNGGEDAHAVLGTCMSQLRQTLGAMTSFRQQARALDEFFLHRAVRSATADCISSAVSHIVRQRGCIDMGALADGAGLSPRHFTRRFMDHMAIRPKLFTRIVRFQAALESKALHPGKSWTEVAQDFGYFDQMHLIHDFEQLAAGSPKQLLVHLERNFLDEIRRIHLNARAAQSASDARLML